MTVIGEIGYDMSQGILTRTARRLDLGIEGDGFFVINSPEGPLYSRNGSFHVNALGQIVDPTGDVVAGTSGTLVLPGNKSSLPVNVSRDGTVSIEGAAIGKVRVVNFSDPSILTPVGATRFEAPEDVAPDEASDYSIHQGAQESSNVNVASEMVDLITVTRMYEANLKVIIAQDERMANILGVALA